VAAALALAAAARGRGPRRRVARCTAEIWMALGAWLDAQGRRSSTPWPASPWSWRWSSPQKLLRLGSDASGYLRVGVDVVSTCDTRRRFRLSPCRTGRLRPGDVTPAHLGTGRPGLEARVAGAHLRAGASRELNGDAPRDGAHDRRGVFFVGRAGGWPGPCEVRPGALAWRNGGGSGRPAGVAAAGHVAHLYCIRLFLADERCPGDCAPGRRAGGSVARGSPARAGRPRATGPSWCAGHNLAPLAAIPWRELAGRGLSVRRCHAVRFAALRGLRWVRPSALLQWPAYGSPLASGYPVPRMGALRICEPPANLGLYMSWLWEGSGGVRTLTERASAIAPAWPGVRRQTLENWTQVLRCWKKLRRIGGDRACPLGSSSPPCCFLAPLAGRVAYLVYAVFEVWSYVRF